MINRNRNKEDKDNEIDKIATLSSFSMRRADTTYWSKSEKGILNEAIIISKELLDLERMDLTQVKENNNIKFGCYIYQDGLTYKDIVHIALECERLGYDSIWLKDNYIPWIQDYLVSHLNNNANIRKLTKNKWGNKKKLLQTFTWTNQSLV